MIEGLDKNTARSWFARESVGNSKHPLPITQEKTLHVAINRGSTEFRLIIYFAAKDGEALYSQKNKTRS